MLSIKFYIIPQNSKQNGFKDGKKFIFSISAKPNELDSESDISP